jgi:hypothetical protein
MLLFPIKLVKLIIVNDIVTSITRRRGKVKLIIVNDIVTSITGRRGKTTKDIV